MRTESRAGFVLGIVIFLGLSTYAHSGQLRAGAFGPPATSDGQRPSPTEEEACQVAKLPPNIEMSDGLARLLEKIYLRSAAFRAHCARIAGATNLQVTIQVSHAIPRSCRAFTKVHRQSGLIRADVFIPLAGILFAEIIGHEFEHIVEQIDGLNLRVLARTRGSGVHEVEDDVFETERAKRVGLIVAEESHPRSRKTTHPVAD